MIKKDELKRDLFAAYDYIEKHMGKDALNSLIHHTYKQDRTKQDVDKLKYMLNSAYTFIEMSMGKQTLNTLIKATEREYAAMKTDKLLECHDPKEFEDMRMEIVDANEWEIYEQAMRR